MKGGPLYTPWLTDEEIFRRGHGLLVFTSLLAAVMLLVLALLRVGKLVSKVPHCIVVGFTIGIAVTIGFSVAEEALGLEKTVAYEGVWKKLVYIHENIGHMNGHALVIALATLISIQFSMHFSVLIPAGLLAIACSAILAQTVWSEKHLKSIFDSYGHIAHELTFTPPIIYIGNGAGNALYAGGALFYYAFA